MTYMGTVRGIQLREAVLDIAFDKIETLHKDERLVEFLGKLPRLFNDIVKRAGGDGRVRGWLQTTPEVSILKDVVLHVVPERSYRSSYDLPWGLIELAKAEFLNLIRLVYGSSAARDINKETSDFNGLPIEI